MFAKLLVWVIIGSFLKSYIFGEYVNPDTVLNKAQKEAFDKFKKDVLPLMPEEYMKSDIYLIKWLMEKEFDVDKATQFLKNDLQWRKEMGMEYIHYEDFSDVAHLYPYNNSGRDTVGRPVLYVELGNIDVRGAVIRGQSGRLSRYAIKVMDETCRLVQEISKTNSNVTRGTLISNAKGFNVIQHACLQCMPFLLQYFSALDQHFPLCAHRVILINSPTAILPVLETIKNLMSRNIALALKFYGTNTKENLRRLVNTEDFDLEHIPVQIGGLKETKMKGLDY